VTGLPAGPLSVAVVASVHTTAGALFTPTLRLNLTPLQLSLAGDATTLTVRDSSTVAHTERGPPLVDAAGTAHHRCSRPRRVSILLLAALLAAAILGFIARHTSPGSEGPRIRRRYAPLLASVHPITTPTNLPPIEVSEFATLAKLAERCGLLVLHWSRSGVDTFIVLDEGTTYRYRTGSDLGPGAEGPAPLSSSDHTIVTIPDSSR
jgi:hypothetical protein